MRRHKGIRRLRGSYEWPFVISSAMARIYGATAANGMTLLVESADSTESARSGLLTVTDGTGVPMKMLFSTPEAAERVARMMLEDWDLSAESIRSAAVDPRAIARARRR